MKALISRWFDKLGLWFDSRPETSLEDMFHNVNLWLNYNNTYIGIKKSGPKSYGTRDDPGVAFMKKGWRIFWIIIFVIALLNQ